MFHDPVKLMAQITVFPHVIMYSHDVEDEWKQITAMLSYNTQIWWALIINTKERLNHRRELDNKFSVCIVDPNTLI